MKQLINVPDTEIKVKIASVPVPEPSAKQILIKVIVSGSNPKDWRIPVHVSALDIGPDDGPSIASSMASVFQDDYIAKINGALMARSKVGVNQGDDIAGIVEKVGKDVLEFKKGDRVAAFHEMGSPGGSYAEYALAWDWTTFHIPAMTSFEEAATIPLTALTAAIGLFRNLRLPTPWNPAKGCTPLLVYGAGTAVGSFAVKLAQNSNIHPIIAFAGKTSDYIETLIDREKGDAVFDYRKDVNETIRDICDHLGAGNYGQVLHGFDAGIGGLSEKFLTEIVSPGGAIDLVVPSAIDVGPRMRTKTSVGIVHDQTQTAVNMALVTCRWFTKAMQAGTFGGHPFEVRSGGLEGVEQALKDMSQGKRME